jgi:hypothetical protein
VAVSSLMTHIGSRLCILAFETTLICAGEAEEQSSSLVRASAKEGTLSPNHSIGEMVRTQATIALISPSVILANQV